MEVDVIGKIKNGETSQEIGMNEFKHFHDKPLWLDMIGYLHHQITCIRLLVM